MYIFTVRYNTSHAPFHCMFYYYFLGHQNLENMSRPHHGSPMHKGSHMCMVQERGSDQSIRCHSLTMHLNFCRRQLKANVINSAKDHHHTPLPPNPPLSMEQNSSNNIKNLNLIVIFFKQKCIHTYLDIIVPMPDVWRTSCIRTKRFTVPLPAICYLVHCLFQIQNLPWP